MTLASVTRGRIAVPLRGLIYGTEGIGKSTYCASAPNALILDIEHGTHHIDLPDGAGRLHPETWEEVFDALRMLLHEQHQYQMVVFDTVDALEPLCWTHVCKAAGKANIEDFGYGKGFLIALTEWQRLLSAIEGLQKAKGLSVLFVGHTAVKTFKNPAGADYDRYTLKIHQQAAGLLKEWCDLVLFARYEEYVREDTSRPKGVSDGSRRVYTQRMAAWDAKNRFSLPEHLPLNWEDLAKAIAARQPADPAKLLTTIAELTARLEGAPPELFDRPAFEKAMAGAGNDAARLAQIKDRLTAKLAQKEA